MRCLERRTREMLIYGSELWELRFYGGIVGGLQKL